MQIRSWPTLYCSVENEWKDFCQGLPPMSCGKSLFFLHKPSSIFSCKKFSFTDGIIWQILYMDSLVIPGLDIPTTKPRISAWSGKLLRNAIKLDTNSDGSFGKLRVCGYIFLLWNIEPYLLNLVRHFFLFLFLVTFLHVFSSAQGFRQWICSKLILLPNGWYQQICILQGTSKHINPGFHLQALLCHILSTFHITT